MENPELSADTCALVAAQLTQAHMALISGGLAGRNPGQPMRVAPNAVEQAYRHFYAFARTGAIKPLRITD